MPVTYHVSDNLQDPATLAAIDQAFATWAAVACAELSFVNGGQFTMCTAADKTACPAGTVHFDHATAEIYVFWYDAANASAYPANPQFFASRMLWYGTSQDLVGASIAVNGFDYAWDTTGGNATTLDVQNEMTALVGGVIGMAKSTVPGATMYPDTQFGDTSKRTLAQDDIDGVTYLYPDPSCPTPPPPDPSCTAASDAGPGADGALADAWPPADLGAMDAGLADGAQMAETGADARGDAAPASDAQPALDAVTDSLAEGMATDDLAAEPDQLLRDQSAPAPDGPTAADGGAEGRPPPGTEGGPCYGNSTCNEGLTCASGVCVRVPPVDEGCACRLQRSAPTSGGAATGIWLLGALLGALAFSRRR
jgi:hypothetical protein